MTKRRSWQQRAVSSVGAVMIGLGGLTVFHATATQAAPPPPPPPPVGNHPPAPPQTPPPQTPPPQTPPPQTPPPPTPPQTPPPQTPPPPTPPPPTPPPQSPPPATPAEMAQTGPRLFNDKSLSNPAGVSCSTCHAQQTGWTFPVSKINQEFGPVPGAVTGRFGNRRPPTIGYASFMPPGPPTFIAAFFSYQGGFFYDGRAATLSEQVSGPMQNPNEMNNTPAGVVQAIASGPNAHSSADVRREDHRR